MLQEWSSASKQRYPLTAIREKSRVLCSVVLCLMTCLLAVREFRQNFVLFLLIGSSRFFDSHKVQNCLNFFFDWNLRYNKLINGVHSVQSQNREVNVLKAHVHPSGFALVSFCLLNAVFWLAVISQVAIFNFAKFPQCVQGDSGPLNVMSHSLCSAITNLSTVDLSH